MRNHNKNKTRGKLFKLALIAIIVGGSYLYNQYGPYQKPVGKTDGQVLSSQLQQAITHQLSDIQVQGSGMVIKVLPDDTRGSQHQRFLLKLINDHVILIAHNIDLAPRIETLQKGDQVSFNGEFEWNEKGGVVHWTHHDPGNRHIHGWLERDGKRYQ